jgi:hypothetical protein
MIVDHSATKQYDTGDHSIMNRVGQPPPAECLTEYGMAVRAGGVTEVRRSSLRRGLAQ